MFTNIRIVTLVPASRGTTARMSSPPPSKRPRNGTTSSSSPASGTHPRREACFFGAKCYRRNPHHFREYWHQHLADIAARVAPGAQPGPDDLRGLDVAANVLSEQLAVFRDVCKDVIKIRPATMDSSANTANAVEKPDKAKSLTVTDKLESAKPFSFFLTKVKDSPETHSDSTSLYITDLLHPSLGKLKRSLQINFMVEWDWLKMNYEATKTEDRPLLILFGEDNPDLHQSRLPENVRAVRIRPRYPFGKHHSKIMVLHYEDDSVRVVVSTANLVASDWENRTQGLWVSPKCPALTEEAADGGESPTGFKADFLRYLKHYMVTPLKSYVDTVRRADFSAVNVVFVGSVPNSHHGPDLNFWGHLAVRAALKRNLPPKLDTSGWPLFIQCSSIGSLGNSESAWFAGELGQSLMTAGGTMASASPGEISLVYPSKGDVLGSYDGLLGGGCLPYAKKTHLKQQWLEGRLCRWVADGRERTRAMPHIKTYARVDPACSKAAYLVLTSSNLSKAAWGSLNKARENLLIMSYEAGVVFLPKFVTGGETFDVGAGGELRLPYDLPLTPYAAQDTPWFMDYLALGPD